MGFVSSLVLFCLCCLASDVVELEPVQSGTYDCDKIAGVNQAICHQNPYCHWATGSSTCIDDPCLKVTAADASGCDPVTISGGVVNCDVGSVTPTGEHDCGGGSGKFCKSQLSAAVYDYCFWANLRDGASNCPPSVCKVVDKKCVAYNYGGSSNQGCQFLTTENDCKLVPKCFWRSSQCIQDPCFFQSEGESCGTWTNNGGSAPGGGTLAAGDCVLYQPYKPDGKVASYCVYKDNKSPNLCYFINGNTTSHDNSATDHLLAYPTYKVGPPVVNPLCSGEISGCDTNPSGECSTKINVKGGLAGLYCGDKDHGAANIFQIPSLIMLLITTIFVSMFTS